MGGSGAARIAGAFLASLCTLAANAQDHTAACPDGQRECYDKLMRAHPVRQAAHWTPLLAMPVEQRIRAAPPELVQFLSFDNLSNGYPNKPRSPHLTPEFLADVQRAYAGIPQVVKRKLASKLAGLFFIDDLGSTGFSDMALDRDGRETHGFIVLDAAVLKPFTGNAWSTWKDGTPFRPDPRWKLESIIAAPGNDDRVAAIRYILLHEIAHVLSVGAGVHPSWALKPAEVGDTKAFAFYNLSWTVAGGRYATRFDQAFPQRKDITYYFGAKLDGADMAKAYEALGKTSFPTLYAATHPGDDFAESFANFVHVVMLGQPFEVRISKDGRVVKTVRDCWKEARCAAKRALLEDFLRQ